ncbi:Uma2 family endonuclease [soil metagenome]
MEMSSPQETLFATEPVRKLKRVEFDRLVAAGCFDDERVELLFGVVVEMPPTDPSHDAGVYAVHMKLMRSIGERARVQCQSSFAASDESEPVPDVFVVSHGRDVWNEHATSAHLVVEVSNSSLRRDRGTKALVYALTDVHEYWVVNLARGEVEVYRDREAGAWRTKSTHRRGETISPQAFPDVMVAVSEIVPPLEP